MMKLSDLKVWFYEVSRGYTLPMSLLPCAIAVLLGYKLGGNLLFGIIASVGVICAHLGTNVFDDFIDSITKTPKQKCKTQYLDNNFTTIPKIFVFAMFYFAIAFVIGLFFFFNVGWQVVIPVILGGAICLVYPVLTKFFMGEATLSLAFGPLLFGGISYVMLSQFNLKMLLISVPVALFITVLLIAHALMDYDFDILSGKKTFCTLLKSKQNALKGLMAVIAIGYVLTLVLVYLNIMPLLALFTLLTVPLAFKLNKGMSEYILAQNDEARDFMANFKLARSLSVYYNLILLAVFILK